MSNFRRTRSLREAAVELSIGDWLNKFNFQVFDESPDKDRPQWGFFEVRKIKRGKRPDLIVRGNLREAQILKKNVYVAIEIKPGYKHQHILNGFDAILDYFSDYLWGAEYWINKQCIDILFNKCDKIFICEEIKAIIF